MHMPIRNLMLSAALAASTLVGAPSLAAPSTCWFPDNDQQERIKARDCDISLAEERGLNVITITGPNGYIKVTLFQDNGDPAYALVNAGGSEYRVSYEFDEDGDVRVFDNDTGYEFYFTIPVVADTPTPTRRPRSPYMS